MPKTAIDNGSHAVIGIGLSSCTVGSSIPDAVLFHPIARPTGTATTMAARNPFPTRSAENIRLANHVPLWGLRLSPVEPKAQTFHACQARSGVGSTPPNSEPFVPAA